VDLYLVFVRVVGEVSESCERSGLQGHQAQTEGSMKPSPGKCQHCGEPIQWAVNRETGNKTPLDPAPDRIFGNLLVDEWNWSFVKLELAVLERAIERNEPLYVNHLTMCEVLKQKQSEAA
jgi:hypothetical protein